MDDREASPTQLYDALQCLGGDAPLLSPVEAEAELEALEGSLHCAAVSVTTLQSKFRPRPELMSLRLDAARLRSPALRQRLERIGRSSSGNRGGSSSS